MNQLAAAKPSNRQLHQKAKLQIEANLQTAAKPQVQATVQTSEPLEQQAHCFGAVDIGGTKIAVGIVDKTGFLLASSRFPTDRDPREAVRRICSQLKTLRLQLCEAAEPCGPGEPVARSENRTEPQLAGIGISCAGPVDTASGTVHNPYTLPGWDHYPLQKALAQATALPVLLENDANCALLGEVVLSDLTSRRVLMVSIGTGIGTAFWDGQGFYRTGGRFHPELGHLLISSRRRPVSRCYCGHANCAEHLLSGTALHRRAADAGFQDFTEFCHVLAAGTDPRKTAAALFLQDLQAEFNELFWNYGLVFQPDHLILGGGMAQAYYDLFASFQQNFLLETSQRQDFVPPFQLALAQQGSDTALSGAGLLFRISAQDNRT